jgi:hypothetical protein
VVLAEEIGRPHSSMEEKSRTWPAPHDPHAWSEIDARRAARKIHRRETRAARLRGENRKHGRRLAARFGDKTSGRKRRRTETLAQRKSPQAAPYGGEAKMSCRSSRRWDRTGPGLNAQVKRNWKPSGSEPKSTPKQEVLKSKIWTKWEEQKHHTRCKNRNLPLKPTRFTTDPRRSPPSLPLFNWN